MELLVHILGLNQSHSWTLLINVLIELLIQDPPLISVKYFHRTTVLLVVKSFPTNHPDFAVSRNHCRLNIQVCPFTISILELVCILFVQSSKALLIYKSLDYAKLDIPAGASLCMLRGGICDHTPDSMSSDSTTFDKALTPWSSLWITKMHRRNNVWNIISQKVRLCGECGTSSEELKESL